jgi:hypothetical protein
MLGLFINIGKSELKIYRWVFISCGLLFIPPLFAQSVASGPKNISKQFYIQIVNKDTAYQLDDHFIVSGTLKISHDTSNLKISRDYIYDAEKNRIMFLPEFSNRIFKDSLSSKQVCVSYKVFPFDFKYKYAHKEIVYKRDTTLGKVVRVSKPLTSFTTDNIFGGNLQKSGSLVRGFTFGSNRDLSLSSGFRMQMSGKLSQDIDIAAALTDENSPIQPEGNTQTLQEIDKVYIELKAKNIAATLGDFNLDFTDTEFGKISRKLQGGLGSANYNFGNSNGSIVLSGAVSRGKYNSNQFSGIEGVQGPYRLVGKNNERSIIIIAGTEKVYIDGEIMKRGDEFDYSIDYALAEITFTSRRLINGNSRIVVDFEYTDRQYTRNFFAARGSSSLMDDKINIIASYIREGDDNSNPIDLTLTDAEKETLSVAGDNRLRAVESGVQLVETGKGQYIKIDTLISGTNIPIYRFLPGDINANYSVSFTYVGEGKGEYTKVSIGNYQFIGTGFGNYLPIRFLPLPQLQTLVDFDVKTKVTEYLKIFGETAISNFDANRFSNLDDGNNAGGAYRFGLQLNPQDITIGNTNLGSFDLQLKERIISDNFVEIDRVNDVEYGRKWNLSNTSQLREESGEGLLFYTPFRSLRVSNGLGYLKMGNQFSSNRTQGELSFNESSIPQLSYQYELIKSKDVNADDLGKWWRNKALTEYKFWKINSSFIYEGEKKNQSSVALDTLKAGSYSFDEYSPKLMIEGLYGMNFGVELKWRQENRLFKRSMSRESNITTQTYSLAAQPFRTLSTNADVTIRKRKYTEAFKVQSGGNTESILVRWMTRFATSDRGIESDLLYDASTQRSARLERVFQRVPKGTGSYIYLGDIDSNGVATEDEFRLTRFDGDYVLLTVPSDNLSPVIDLKLNGRLRFVPSKFISETNFFAKGISALSSETYLRIEEKSTETVQRNIYLLNMKYFLNDKTTLAGNNSITQDVFLFEQNQDLSIRFRFQQRKGLTQYALGTEKSYNRQQSVRVRWQLIQEIANQTEYEHRIDQVAASKYNSRVRNISGNSLMSDWAYRPYTNIELGFKFSIERSENRDESSNSVADINTQGVRLIYSIQERGIARFEFNREEVVLSGMNFIIPFELTGGRFAGKTWLWRLSAEYRITNFLQSTLNYDGRIEGQARTIHAMRAEVRAFF